jgi:hypothetical protein
MLLYRHRRRDSAEFHSVFLGAGDWPKSSRFNLSMKLGGKARAFAPGNTPAPHSPAGYRAGACVISADA